MGMNVKWNNLNVMPCVKTDKSEKCFLYIVFNAIVQYL